MRFVCVLGVILVTIFSSPSRSTATTFNLPLNGVVEILGAIPSPMSVSVTMTASLNGAFGLEYSAFLGQSGQIDGPFSQIQGCIGTTCGTFAGFAGCGGNIGCGFQLVSGTIIAAVHAGGDFSSTTFPSVSFDVSDSSRFLASNSSLVLELTLFTLTPVIPDSDHLQLIINLPDSLTVGTLGGHFVDLDETLLSETPLPGTLPLFAIGLGALGLLGWHRKRKHIA